MKATDSLATWLDCVYVGIGILEEAVAFVWSLVVYRVYKTILALLVR